ncbi:copper type II ascorbate-dependent monooxygenase domain protein [Cooperia oncophora]
MTEAYSQWVQQVSGGKFENFQIDSRKSQKKKNWNTRGGNQPEVEHFTHFLSIATDINYRFFAKCGERIGGYAIEEEMCVNYLYYFPASEVEVCKSAVDNETLNSYFENV